MIFLLEFVQASPMLVKKFFLPPSGFPRYKELYLVIAAKTYGYDVQNVELMPKYENPFSYILDKGFIMLT